MNKNMMERKVITEYIFEGCHPTTQQLCIYYSFLTLSTISIPFLVMKQRIKTKEITSQPSYCIISVSLSKLTKYNLYILLISNILSIVFCFVAVPRMFWMVVFFVI